MKRQKTINKPYRIASQKQTEETKIIAQEPAKPQEAKGWKFVFVGLAITILVTMILLSFDAGMSGDESYHSEQSKYVYDFYRTMGKDTTAVIPQGKDGNYREYGQVADNIAYIISITTGSNDLMQIRHYTSTVFGWLGILFASLLAFSISKKWYAAIITALLLFLSPRYLGHSFNNLKDIPFAATMMMGIYYIIRFLQTFPKPSIKICIMLAVSIGLAIGTRIGGLLLVAFFGLFSLFSLISIIWQSLKATKQERGEKTSNPSLANPALKLTVKMVLYGIIISLGGYVLALAVWPFVMLKPVDNAVFVFNQMSQFAYSLRQLFEGTMQWSQQLPWYYTPKYILITIPLAVILGFVVYPFLGGLKKENRFYTFIVYFVCVSPIFWIAYSNANVYGGWRHAMFVYPPMVVAAGLGFSALVDLFKNWYIKIVFIALPLLMAALPLSHIIRNHPYEYVYFNEIGGGVKNAYGKYEFDYYYHSTRKATEWIIKNAKEDSLVTGDKIRVASWHVASVNYYLRNSARFETVFSRWEDRGNYDWDYAIFVVSGISPEQINGKHFPPANTIHTIDVDGKPICLILKRYDKSDFQAIQYIEQEDAANSIMLLEKALKHDPYNEAALVNLMKVYYYIDQLDNHVPLLNHALEYLPKDKQINWYNAYQYLMKKDYDQVIEISNQMIADDCTAREFYRLLYIVYQLKKEYKPAEKTLLKMIENNVLEPEDADRLVEVYMAQGIDKASAQYKFLKLIQSHAEKEGNKKYAEYYRKYAEQFIQK